MVQEERESLNRGVFFNTGGTEEEKGCLVIAAALTLTLKSAEHARRSMKSPVPHESSAGILGVGPYLSYPLC